MPMPAAALPPSPRARRLRSLETTPGSVRSIVSRLLKLLHTLGAVGLAGGLACYIVLLLVAPSPIAIDAYASSRGAIAAVCKWLVLPSLLLVLTSGLLAIAANRVYMNARWAWLKALLGLAMFEGTLGGVQAPAERGAKLASRAINGEIDPLALPALINDEMNVLWFLLALSIANIVLAIWRPRLRRRADA